MQWPVCRGTVLYAEALYAEAPYAELYAVCSKYAAYAANMQRMLTDAYAQKKLYAAYAAGALANASQSGDASCWMACTLSSTSLMVKVFEAAPHSACVFT